MTDKKSEDWAFQPAETSVLGDLWRDSDVYKNYGKYKNKDAPQPAGNAPALAVVGAQKGAPFQQQPTTPVIPNFTPVDWQSKLPPGMMNEPALPMADAMAAYGKLPSVQQTPASVSKAYADALIGSAKALPGQPIPVTKEAGIRDQLSADGFSKLNSLPGNQDPRSGASYLGPNDIFVKERLGTPKEYTAAVQNNQDSTRFGQQVGLDQGTEGYAPNDATLSGMKNGGAITEYAVPGKGTATFYGERRGGGGLSVVSSPTKEQLDSQFAAMRDLRNAKRLDQGMLTVEQQEQQNAMASMMNRLAPPPDMSGYQKKEDALMQQLNAATGLNKPGQSRQRDDAIKAAQVGLGAVGNSQQLAQQQAAERQRTALGLVQNNAEQAKAEQAAAAAAAKAAQEQAQWRATFDFNADRGEKDDFHRGTQTALDREKSAREATQQGRTAETQGLTADAAQTKAADQVIKNRFTDIDMKTQQPVINYERMSKRYRIPPLPAPGETPQKGVYATPTGFVAFDENGNDRVVSDTEIVNFFEARNSGQQSR